MKRQTWRWWVMAAAVIGVSGCRSTRLDIHTYPGPVPQEGSAKILGLPLMGGGAQLDAAGRRQREQEIDESLGRRWESRYVPISEVRTAHKELLLPWAKGMVGNCDLAVRLRINAAQCRALGLAAGCRYAVLPTIGRCASTEANVLNIGYVIPAGMVIIVGSMPVFLGQYEIEDMPVCTMALIDLEEATVVSEALLATRDKKIDPFAAYPEALINGIIRADRILQARKP